MEGRHICFWQRRRIRLSYNTDGALAAVLMAGGVSLMSA